MFRFLWRVSREALTLHLIVPLLASLLVGTGFAIWKGKILDVDGFYAYWAGDHAIELLTIYIVFVGVLVHLANSHAETRITNLATLDDLLPNSTAYFALGAIPLAEWFQPSVQVYFGTLLKQSRLSLEKTVAQLEKEAPNPARTGTASLPQSFTHQRVLLFLTPHNLMDAHSSVLDGFHARCLVRMHEDSASALGYLPPDSLYRILDALSPEQKKVFGYSRRWRVDSMWWPLRFWDRRRLTEALAFAEVSRTDGTKNIVKFLKRPNELSVRTLTEAKDMAPYQALVTAVRAVVFHGNGTLRADYDFGKHIEL